MKKILVSGLLGSVLAVSAVWGENSNQLDKSILDYIDYQVGDVKPQICDNPKSKECIEAAKADCPAHLDLQSCIEATAEWNTTAYNMRNAEQAMSGFLTEMIKQYNKKQFNEVLQYAKTKKCKIESILTLPFYVGNKETSLIREIAQKNLVEMSRDIRENFGSLKGNKIITNELNNFKAHNEIKNILLKGENE